MPRSNAEFLQAQWLDWQSSPVLPHLGGTQHKVLSCDQNSGEMTVLVQYPPGWLTRDLPSLEFNEEFYILDGELDIDGVIFSSDYYTYLPIGFPRSLSRSRAGAVALTFFTREKATTDSFDSRYQDFAHGMWVPRTNAFNAIWPAAADKMIASNAEDTFARRCDLRQDPHTRAETFLVGFPPVWSIPTSQMQEVDADLYLLAGTVTLGGRGVMVPGAHMWCGIGMERASMGSLDAAVFLVRSHHSPFRTSSGEHHEVNLQKPESYNCVIPNEFESLLVRGPYGRKV